MSLCTSYRERRFTETHHTQRGWWTSSSSSQEGIKPSKTGSKPSLALDARRGLSISTLYSCAAASIFSISSGPSGGRVRDCAGSPKAAR